MSIDWSKPVQTRDGRPVRILCTDRSSGGGAYKKIIGLVKCSTGAEAINCWTDEGVFSSEPGQEHHDLVQVPPPKLSRTVKFLLIRGFVGGVETTCVVTDNCFDPSKWTVIARKAVTITEGEGVPVFFTACGPDYV